MRALWFAMAVVVVPAACGGAQRGRGAEGAGPAEVRLTLYRDGAFVEEDVVVDVAAGEGGARLPRPAGVDVGELMIESDKALYQAKRMGKNTIYYQKKSEHGENQSTDSR